jgi:hypothetical protein
MATGSEISEVFCAAARRTLWPLVSQYNRADEVALFVSQQRLRRSGEIE